MTMTAWDGNWESFKQKFEVIADLNDTNEAVLVGQLLAEGRITWFWMSPKVECPDEYSCDGRNIRRSCIENDVKRNVVEQSHHVIAQPGPHFNTVIVGQYMGSQKSIVRYI